MAKASSDQQREQHGCSYGWGAALHRPLLALLGCLSLGLGLGSSPSAWAQTSTTLSFDTIADSTPLTNQYPGVAVSGATVYNSVNTTYPPVSGTNVAFSDIGNMRVTFNPAITGNVQAVSAYITGISSIGLFVYDAANNLVGQSILGSDGTNVRLSVTSSGNPIARVEIHDGGSAFAVDDLTFTSHPPQSDVSAPLTTDVLVAPNPVAINTPVTLTATVDDRTTGNSLIAGATYTLDGGSPVPMTAQDNAFDSPVEVVTAALGPFPLAGVYRPCVQGRDNAGNSTADVGTCTALAVYDPAAGFVTGGGWIPSPAGAYPAQPELTGKAEFGFVSRYKKGATTPNGEMEFEFEGKTGTAKAHFHFRTSSYDWLVLNGGEAQFTGKGRIDGTGNYSFLVTAVDSKASGKTKDVVRIKLWDTATGQVIYNNEPGARDNDLPVTPLGGGNIKVQKGN